MDCKKKIRFSDARREVAIYGDCSSTIDFCKEHFISTAQSAIESKNAFYVALSGGSTPKSIFQSISSENNKHRIDWTKVYLFWSDERTVSPDHPDSNFAMAMNAGLQNLPINQKQIFRMKAESKDLEKEVENYERIIQEVVPKSSFDLVMLGIGEDGHTASLFPFTDALHIQNRLAAANYIPQKETWRMTLTFDCLNLSKLNVVYILGSGKAEIVKTTLLGGYEPDRYPIQRVGLVENKSLWIMDEQAAKLIH